MATSAYTAEQEVSACTRDLRPSLADIEKFIGDMLTSARLCGQFTAQVLPDGKEVKKIALATKQAAILLLP